jgi:hemerythrin superfamily protein
MPTRPHGSAALQAQQDAIAALTADHRKVKGLFKQFEQAKQGGRPGATRKNDLVAQICDELKIHAEIEEEIFYPAVRKQIDDNDLMDEALVEHTAAKDLIAQLESMDPNDDLYDAKVTVLSEQIAHHVKEEEEKMFPQATKAKVDTARLGVQMEKRRSELKKELGISDPHETEDDEGEPKEVSPKKRRA